jgi:hypothetical protein
MEINWPDAYKPENTSVHVRNELLMPDVKLERVWAWLCRPCLWPTWYSNSSNVHIKNQTQPDPRLGELRLGTEFRWKTFGVAIDSTMLEFVRHERLAWDAHCNGVCAYRAWGFPAISEWPQVFTNARLCKAVLDRLTDQAHIIETGSESYRFRRTLRKKRKE